MSPGSLRSRLPRRAVDFGGCLMPMRAAIFSLAIGIGFAVGAAQQFSAEPMAMRGEGDSVAERSDGIVIVKARGFGVTKIEALKDAYRDAVERAVGLYVDYELQAKNEDALNDQVLKQCNAYIEKYDILKEEQAKGLIQVRIVAYVKKMALTRRLAEVVPAQTVTVSEASKILHAQVVTKAMMQDDALQLVRNEFANFNPVKQLLTAEFGATEAEVEYLGSGAATVRLWYPIDIAVDNGKYANEFIPRIDRIFNQIKMAPAKEINLYRAYQLKPKQPLDYGKKLFNRRGLGDVYEQNAVKSFTGTMMLAEGSWLPLRGYGMAFNEQYVDMFAFCGWIDGSQVVVGVLKEYSQYEQTPDVWKWENAIQKSGRFKYCCANDECYHYGSSGGPRWESGKVFLAKECRSSSTLSGTLYELPPDCARLMGERMRLLLDWDRSRRTNSQESNTQLKILGQGGTRSILSRSWSGPNGCSQSDVNRSATSSSDGMLTSYEVKFFDSEGKEVGKTGFVLRNPDVSNVCFVSTGEDDFLMITPLVSGCAKKFRKWIAVEMKQDDIERIDSVSIEFVE